MLGLAAILMVLEVPGYSFAITAGALAFYVYWVNSLDRATL
jgi:hypothetical protein